MVDLIQGPRSSRGNSALLSALPLTKSLQSEIAKLSSRLERITENSCPADSRLDPNDTKTPERSQTSSIMDDIRKLLVRLDQEIPLLQLAITASGQGLSSSLPPSISPSRLLQASALLISADAQFARDPSLSAQLGPTFTLSLYMVFNAHAPSSATGTAPKFRQDASLEAEPTLASAGPTFAPRGHKNIRQPIWQEVIHKARVRIIRVGQSNDIDLAKAKESDKESPKVPEYEYNFEVLQDHFDGRVHTYDSQMHLATTIAESFSLGEVSKLFYADTGRILNISDEAESENKPVLLLKRDLIKQETYQGESDLSRQVTECPLGISNERTSSGNEQADVDWQLLAEISSHAGRRVPDEMRYGQCTQGFPSCLDHQWIALQVCEEDDDDNDNDDDDDDDDDPSDASSEVDSNHIGLPRSEAAKCHKGQVVSSLDPTLVSQLKELSFRRAESSETKDLAGEGSVHMSQNEVDKGSTDFIGRSPFRTVTTSLSLLEMLIRLAGLQCSQQLSHLAIPDHILNFFLEETSSTGLVGEEQVRERRCTRQTIGFDPYTDDTV